VERSKNRAVTVSDIRSNFSNWFWTWQLHVHNISYVRSRRQYVWVVIMTRTVHVAIWLHCTWRNTQTDYLSVSESCLRLRSLKA